VHIGGTSLKPPEDMETSLSVEAVPLYDNRNVEARVQHPPVVHFAHGYTERFFSGWLTDSTSCSGPRCRALICLSDWQFDTSTQEHFWEQAGRLIEDVLNRCNERALLDPLVLVAGDMASCNNALRGVASDAAPDFAWLQQWIGKRCGPGAELYFIYGNHDLMSEAHLEMRNGESGCFCLLPHGGLLDLETSTVLGTPWETDSKSSQDVTNLKKCQGQRASHLEADDPAAKDVLELFSTLRHDPLALADELGRQKLDREQVASSLENLALTKAERSVVYKRLQERKKDGGIGSERTLDKRSIQQKQWRDQNPDQARLYEQFLERQGASNHGAVGKPGAASDSVLGTSPVRRSPCIGAVHGIPASFTQGLKKTKREEYFRVCERIMVGNSSRMGVTAPRQSSSRNCPVGSHTQQSPRSLGLCPPRPDVVVTHSNPCLPGQESIVHGDDAKRIFRLFMRSPATLLLHGHMHTESVVEVIPTDTTPKVVVNADCRVVVFVPGPRPC
jgi:hypothetical protein